MKIVGFTNDEDKDVELREATLSCTIEELDRFIEFITEIRDIHKKFIDETELLHSHYRDWDNEWNETSTDIVIMNINEKKLDETNYQLFNKPN